MGTLAVGIDLGTANTRVAVYRNDDFEIIPYEDGRSMPSYVSFGDKQRLFGADAKRQANRNPENTVFNVLRLIGRDFNDAGLQKDLNCLPFRVVGDETPFIQVHYLGNEVQFTPQEVLAMILSKAKQNAEAYLHSTVKEVQISVPADFGVRKYDAVRDAAAIAGLKVIELLPSPTCASYLLGVTRPQKDPYSYVIVDAGASGFSACVMSSENGVHQVLSVVGDLGLGGEDFLKILVNRFAKTIKSMWDKDITTDRRAIQRLRSACEQAIWDLSSAQSTDVHIPALYEGHDFNDHLTRQNFESYISGLMTSMRDMLNRVLREAKVTKSDVKHIFPLGGCSRMPQIRKLLSEFFYGMDLDGFLDAAEAQAYGLAAGRAIKMGDQSNRRLTGSLLISVLPKSFGVGTLGAGFDAGLVQGILRKNSTINKDESVFSLSLDDQDPDVPRPRKHGKTKSTDSLSPCVRVLDFYEGESSYASMNEHVGSLQLGPLLVPPKPEPISLSVELHARTGLQVQATVTVLGVGHGQMSPVSVHLGNRMPQESLRQSIADETRYQRADDFEAQRVSQRVRLDRQISDMSEMLSTNYDLVVKIRPDLPGTLRGMRTWLDENQDATLNDYQSRFQILTSIQWDLQDRSTQGSQSQPSANPAPQHRENADGVTRTPKKANLLKKEIQEMISWLDQVQIDFEERRKQLMNKLTDLTDSSSDASDGETGERDSTDGCSGRTAGSARPYQPPPSRTPAEIFESHFDGSKESYTAADLKMISAFLRATGPEGHSKNPKLYTILRLIGELHLFHQFVEDGVSDASIPLDYESLPSSINMRVATKFINQQKVVSFEL
ncbi:heat shock 70 kDa protein [Apiospora saccharicola]|uniref:Heat shock 70 kDa protein n=1 Tax=Apiospora saccharicola TaxID=335842 RepID=A0ABR1UJP1_9PEZI